LNFANIRTIQDLENYIASKNTTETGVLKVDKTFYIYDKGTKRIIEIIEVK